MTEIVLQVFRFGFLLLLWLFIFAAFRVVRARSAAPRECAPWS